MPSRINPKRHLTILHSNDLHGDFFPQEKDGVTTGGINYLAGYVRKVRKEEENVLYVNSGDMFRGSVIDAEYRGLSTIDLMNSLAPDVSTIGNHEVDYGLAHLLFLEKCARFPIINANLLVTLNNARLFQPYLQKEVGGMKILFIGILTEEVLAMTKSEKVIGTFIDIEAAAKEIGIICDNYRTRHTDMVVLLTHIGIEADRELAQLLDPDWGVDLIIGGHSHTLMEEPEIVNGVPIVQVGTGSGHIGRFDIDYDAIRNKIIDWKWECIPITPEIAESDPVMERLLDRYQGEMNEKFHCIITTFARELTHPSRTQETELGNLYSDLLQWESSFDIMMMGSGAIRKQTLGPIVEYQDMVETTPFDDHLWMLKVTGKQFRQMIQFMLRDEAWEGHTEFYQFSKGVRIKYRKSTHTIEEFKLNGEDIKDDQELLIALQTYHYDNFTDFFSVPFEEVKANMEPRVVATSVNNIIEEYFMTHQGLDAHVEGRLEILE